SKICAGRAGYTLGEYPTSRSATWKIFFVCPTAIGATNQVRYNLNSRGIETDLLPWCEKRGMPVMVYSPLGGPGSSLLRDSTLAHIAAAHECSPAAVALAWTIRSGHVIAISESGSVAHVKENAVALSLMLTPQELETLNATFPTQWADILRSVR